jgi:multiple sugar transport system substrate-binding protein
MKRNTALVAVIAVAFTGTVAGCSSPAGGDGPVTLSYQSLAWQSTSIQTNKDIVDEWNAANPDIQVEYIQGDWGSVGDQLTTSFQGGKAPDLFHFYDTGIQPYARQAYLLDLDGKLSESFVSDIRDASWQNVSFPGLEGVWGVPFLQEPTVVIANKAILDEAGIDVPAADEPWTWDEYQQVAAQLSGDTDGDGSQDRFGAAMPLANGGTGRFIPLAPAFGASYFNDEGTALEWGAAEAELPTRIHDMLHSDQSMSLDVLGLGPADLLPAFFEGRYATIMVGAYLRQQIIEGAPEGFEWVVLPTLVGETQEQSNGAQTISISEQTEHPEEAVKFLEFLLNPENQARLAIGDWLTPTSVLGGEILAGEDPALGWEATIASTEHLVQAGFQSVAGFDEWTSRVGDPLFAEYFKGTITIDELVERLVADGDPILERAAER